MNDAEECATLVTSRLVRAGCEEQFDDWADDFDARACAAQGCRGLVRLEQPDGLAHFVQRFASMEALQAWLGSDERRRLDAAADAFSVCRDQRRPGTTASLRLPSEQAAPKWKTWLATWVVVFPLLLTLNFLFSLLPFKLPQPVQLAATSLIMTATLTWFILPQVRRRLRPWLLAGEKGLRKEPG